MILAIRDIAVSRVSAVRDRDLRSDASAVQLKMELQGTQFVPCILSFLDHVTQLDVAGYQRLDISAGCRAVSPCEFIHYVFDVLDVVGVKQKHLDGGVRALIRIRDG